MSSVDKSRRTLLGGAAAGAVLAVTGGFRLVELAMADSKQTAASSLVRWGMLINAEKCADCTECVTACNTEHNLQDLGRPETDAQWIRKLEITDNQTGHITSLPMLCQHCENPPCVDVCPTGASFKRDDGVVLVDKHTCIGCRYCVIACPYKARSFVHENLTEQKPWSPRGKGTVESCTFCTHRIDHGGTPACVEACSSTGNGAMVFGDLNNTESEISTRLRTENSRQVREDLGLNTGVRYQNV